MPEITTFQYLRQIDHALDGMAEDSTDKFRIQEIASIQCSLRLAIREFEEKIPDAEIFGKEMIELLRDRIDALAADPETAGYNEQFRDTIPAPAPNED